MALDNKVAEKSVKRRSRFRKILTGLAGLSAVTAGVCLYPHIQEYSSNKFLEYIMREQKKSIKPIVGTVVDIKYLPKNQLSLEDTFDELDPNVSGMEEKISLRDIKNPNPMAYILTIVRDDTGKELKINVLDVTTGPIVELRKRIKVGSRIFTFTGNTYSGGPPYGYIDREQTWFYEDTEKGSRVSDRIFVLTEKSQYVLESYELQAKMK